MKIQIFVGLCLSLLIMSCNTNETTENAAETIPAENIEEVSLDATTWEGFWHLFQEAAIHKDAETMQALCHFNELFPETVLQSDFDNFFNENMLTLIRKSPANSFEVQDEISDEFTEVRSLQLIEADESAYIMLFGKKDGEFGVIRMAKAG